MMNKYNERMLVMSQEGEGAYDKKNNTIGIHRRDSLIRDGIIFIRA
jgi:hypothetical protein